MKNEVIIVNGKELKSSDFVGLHAHSAFSMFDGFGLPQDHMDFAYSNGSNALALTDHGSMNGLSHQLLKAKKMKVVYPLLLWKMANEMIEEYCLASDTSSF